MRIYRARDVSAGFDHDVALKVLRTRLASGLDEKRFSIERQLLAQLNHPNIATLFGGGNTPDHTPYFVMELVQGEPIDNYCENHRVDLAQRLVMFRAICDAVQYAHSQLIIHRDLKPTNILVREDGQIKLLDFGIAKQLETSDADQTQIDELVMTPNYASPEQILGRRLTTATDIYSLGVVLYRLVTGSLPYDLQGTTREAIVTWAQTGKVTPPSEKASPQVARQLRGDIDNIVLKAMANDPAQRYRSAAELADDVERHLAGLTITARAPTWHYRIGKFVRRHRLAVSVSSMMIAALLITTIIAVNERSAALRERDRANQTNAFLSEVLLAPGTAWNSSIPANSNMQLAELIDLLPQEIEKRFPEDPELQLDLLISIGRAQQQNGSLEQASATIEKANAILACCMPSNTLQELFLLQLQYAVARDTNPRDAGQYIDAAARLLPRVANVPRHDAIGINSDMGLLAIENGDNQAAIRHFDRAIGMAANPDTAEERRVLAVVLGNRSVAAARVGDVGGYEHFLGRSIEAFEQLPSPRPHDYAIQLLNLNHMHRLKAEYEQALAAAIRGLDALEAISGGEHPIRFLFLNSIGLMHLRLGDYDQAHQFAARAQASASLPTPHILRRQVHLLASELALHDGDLEAAGRHLQAGIELYTISGHPREDTFALLMSQRSLWHYAIGDTTAADADAETAQAWMSARFSTRVGMQDLIEARRQCIADARPLASCLNRTDRSR